MAIDRKKHGYSIYVNSIEDEKELIKGIYTPLISDWVDIIEDFISISRVRKNNKLAMFKLQESLIYEQTGAESTIQKMRYYIDNPSKAQEFLEKGEIVEEFHISHWKDQIKLYQIILNYLKVVGDGILWRVLEYNRSILYLLCTIHPQGPLKFDKGGINEFDTFRTLFQKKDTKGFAYHPITNFGRLADLTITTTSGGIQFIEAKSSKYARGKNMKERISRQLQRLEAVSKIANMGEASLNKVNFKIITLNKKPDVKIRKICSTIEKIDKLKYNICQLNPYLTILGFDTRYHSEINDIYEKERKKIKKFYNEKELTIFNFFDLIRFSVNRAPISIYPLSTSLISKLLNGRIFFEYVFCKSAFLSEIENSGWKIMKDEIFENSKSLVLTNADGIIYKVPNYILERVIFEGLAIDEIENSFNSIGISPNTNIIINYKDEYKLWI